MGSSHRLVAVAAFGKAAPTTTPSLYDTMAKVALLKKLTETILSSVEPKRFTSDVVGERVGFTCLSDVQQSGVGEQSQP